MVICETQIYTMMPTITETIVFEMDIVPLVVNVVMVEMLSIIAVIIQAVMI
jgi:hypothetical protein